jgi:cytochrome c oxidase cbb3-type subunit 3
MKKLTSILAIVLCSISAFAQSAGTEKTFWDDPVHHPLFTVYVTLTFVSLVILLVAMVSVYTIRVFHMISTQIEKDKAARDGITYVAKPTLWNRLTQKLNKSVPVEQESEIEMDHSYDGIRELDNHLPPWWKWLFYGTIGWAVVYIVIYHLSKSLPLQENEYQNELTLATEQSLQLNALKPKEAIDENALTFSKDETIIARGKDVFLNNNCASCHRKDGGGNTIGPNLTDEYWLHGGAIKNIFSTINHGVVEKGMPAWGKAMTPQDVRDVTFYVMSLQGTHPENPKAPQGEVFKVETEMSTDTLKASASL